MKQEAGSIKGGLLPNGWCAVNFDDAIDSISDNGKRLDQKSYEQKGRFPVIDQGEAFIGGFSENEKIVFENPLPIIVFGDHTRRVKFVDFPFVVGAQGVKLLGPKECWHPKFLALQLTAYRPEDRGYGRHFQYLRKQTFLVPPIKEQERVVSKIDELFSDLDAGGAALERARANLKRYRAAVLKAAVEGRLTQQWRKTHPAAEPASKLLERILAERRKKWEAAQLAKFTAQGKSPPAGWKNKYPEPAKPDNTNLPELPNGWCWATIDQLVIEPVCNGISVKGSDIPPGVAALRLNAMTDTGFDFSQRRYIPLSDDVAADLAIVEGDFFVSRGNGSLRLIGRGTLAGALGEQIVFPDTMIRLRFIPWGRVKDYLSRIWPSRFVRNQIEGKAKTSAGIYKISQSDLSQFVVSLPPITEQEQIVLNIDARLSVIEKVSIEMESQLIRATRLRQSILKRAFEGKLVPQDPNDEPASVLLARIRAARAKDVITPRMPPSRKGRRKAA